MTHYVVQINVKKVEHVSVPANQAAKQTYGASAVKDERQITEVASVTQRADELTEAVDRACKILHVSTGLPLPSLQLPEPTPEVLAEIARLARASFRVSDAAHAGADD